PPPAPALGAAGRPGHNRSAGPASGLPPPGPAPSLGALHGPGTPAGPPGPPPDGPGEPLFGRFLCTPLAAACPEPPDDPPPPRKQRELQELRELRELQELQSTAEQLRLTALQQKARIRADQETIGQLTAQLGRCESGLHLALQDGPPAWEPPAWEPPAWEPPPAVRRLQEAVGALQDRIEKIEQELPARGNASSSTPPHQPRDALHSKMEELEGQLLAKIEALEKERSSLNSDNHQQRQDLEKELNALQSRVAELEHEAPAFSPPDAFKVNIPVRNNYMYARVRKTLPELYSFTICMWLRSKSGGAGLGTPFSYSVPGQANEIVLLEWGHNPMELLINDKVAQLPLNLKDGTWHHICVAWTTRDGLWSAYQDGELRGSSENLAAWHPIKPHGIMVLGQEQDTLGGRFDATQAFVGEISQFNLWDHILTPGQVLGIANCTAPLLGNVVAWDDKLVEAIGGATKSAFDACSRRVEA
ncbi:neuronal pentraxin receptor, partial [Ornithorhynchus anatinus]|uniref:neuronal pentraxin receptor n=1 Tax=Ornithorhynchus anatinus TaxID=9258 RepID=UPI0010A82609